MNYLFLNKAKERSEKLHIIKYKILLNRLETLNAEFFFENSTQNYLAFLSKLKSTDLIANSTDFFWSLVHRLNTALDKKDKIEIEKTYIYFLLNAFDSFYLLLPLDSKIQFKDIGYTDIIFPNLDLSLSCCLDSSVTICKVSNTFISYKFDKFNDIADNNYSINLHDIPHWFSLKKEIVCEKIAIIYQKNENIFEEYYCHDCCDDVFLGHLFKNKIEKAFEKIKAVDSTLYDKLASSIDYIIPMEKNYPNFAIATLKKTIFLSIDLLTHPEIHVAECIVHEYSHCELHCVQDTLLLTNIENNIFEYYSPWRTTPRPLLGLIHAIYVSNEVLCFYFSYLLRNDNHDEALLVRKKAVIIIYRILIAIRQIKKHDLSDFTLELMNVILKSTQEMAEYFSVSAGTLPEEIANHIKLWKSNNLN